jgi:beta-N-acetylhexosaminidase
MALGATAVAAQPASDSSSLVTLDEQIDRMSSDEKIAQLMIVGIPPLMAGAEAERTLAGWRFGGVVLYASNLRTVAQVRQLTAAIRRAGGPIPPFIAVDQEGGIVRRLQEGVPIVPSNMALGATRSADLVRRTGSPSALRCGTSASP